jgi:hypothetical protein
MKRCVLIFITAILTSFLFSFVTYGEVAAALTEIMKPRSMAVDDSQLYITEQTKVFIYSLKDFKLLKSFGEAGEGPGEFKTLPHVPVTVDVSTDRIIVSSMRKISYFTKKGEFINEVKAVNLALNLRLFGDRFVAWSQARTEGVIYNTICLFDSQLNKLKELYRMEDSYQGQGRGYRVLHKVFTYVPYKDKLLLPGLDDAVIDIFDSQMNKLLSIKLDQERRKVDSEFRDKLLNFYKTSPETRELYETHLKPLIFPDYFPAIADFFVDNGTVYIRTWKSENGASEFFTYDLNGKFIRRLFIPFQYETELTAYPGMIKNGKLYQLVENEKKESWELHISTIK